MGIIQSLADIIQKLSEQGVDLNDAAVSMDDIWLRGDDELDDDDDDDA